MRQMGLAQGTLQESDMRLVRVLEDLIELLDDDNNAYPLRHQIYT